MKSLRHSTGDSMLEELSVSREGVLVHAQLVHDLIAILPA